MAYSDLLKDPRWQKKRLKILERDNWTCQFCRSTEKTLSVHHLEYTKGTKPWEYKDSFLVTICQDCHEFEFNIDGDSELQRYLFGIKLLKNIEYFCRNHNE